MAGAYSMYKVIYHPAYKNYDLGPGHPFSPLRIEMVFDLLTKLGCMCETVLPSPVSPEELYAVHGKEYIDAIEAVSGGEKLENIEEYGVGSADNPVVPGMAEWARYQVGGTLLGAKILIENQADKVLQMGGGFHHAHQNLAAGFCLYNDLALALKEMVSAGWHVVYLDLDVHHGDGVQEMFNSDENVMTISFHESGEYLFPGTGWIHELGRGMGRSLKLNLPLEPFTEGDSYMEVLNGILVPALSWFKPNAMVVQCGADPHFSDPLADLMLTTYDFEKIYRRVFELIDKYSNGKALFTFGGGYSLNATPRVWSILYMILAGLDIPQHVPAEWREKWERRIGKELPETLHDHIPAFQPIPRKTEIVRHNKELIRRIMDAVAADWI